MAVRAWVSGKPIAQGSMTAGIRWTGGAWGVGEPRAYVHHKDPKGLDEWRRSIGYAVRAQHAGKIIGPVKVQLAFAVPRAKSNRDPGQYPDGRIGGDIDKLTRAVLDALTGVVIEDDSQVVHVEAVKMYAGQAGPGVAVVLTPLALL